MNRSFVGVLVIAAVVGRAAAAEPAATTGLPSRAAQQRARALAGELVAGVLDGQLRQLEENGLEDRPLHADIASLRGNVEALVNGEMEEVVAILARAESASGDERTALVQEARGTIRAIVARLSMERQRILRRLRIADIVAQARRLLERQRTVSGTTGGLATQPDGRREAVALKTLEDQRTIATLYEALTATLDDVSGWGGEIGAGAVVGLRTLRERQVSPALRTAEERLGALDAAAAQAAQRTVIEGLEALLATIEQAAGVQRTERSPSAAAARDLAEKAAAVRDEIAASPLDDPAIEKLLEEQAAVRDQLDALDQRLQADPRIEPLLEQAQEAALEATAGLFEAQREAAVAEENRVVDALEEIARQLESQPAATPDMRSAAEIARQLAELQAAAAALEPIAAAQEQAAAAAADDPRAAAAQEQSVAQALAALSPDAALPPVIDARLDTAAEAATAASQALAEAAPAATATAMEHATQAAAEATDAVQAAQQEIARAVEDAQRAALAATVGELSRAAEAAERAAATERAIAQAATELAAGAMDSPAADDGTTPPPADGSAGHDQAGHDQAGNDQAGNDPRGMQDAAALAALQEQVAAVSEQLAEAVRPAAPEAADHLAAAAPAMQQALDHLADVAAAAPQPAAPDTAGGDPATPDSAAAPGETADPTAATESGSAPAADTAQTPATQTPATQTEGGESSSLADAPGTAETAAAAAEEAATAAAALTAAAEALRQAAAVAAAELADVAAQQAADAGGDAADPGAPDAAEPGSPQPADATAADAEPNPPAGNAAEARAADLARDAELAREIEAAVQDQIAARDDIAAASEAVTAAAAEGRPLDIGSAQTTPPPASEAMATAAADLAAAEERFADAQQTIGENVAAIVAQAEVGNAPLREALDMASQLSPSGDQPASESSLPGSTPPGPTPPSASGQTGTGSGSPAPSEPAEGSPSTDSPPGGSGQDLGTGFVPESPAYTAAMIAGEEAHDRAAATAASGQPASSEPMADGEDRPTESAGTTPGERTGRGSRQGEAQGGPTTPLERVGRDTTTPPGERTGDAAARDQAVEREAWFARLPPEVRQAIRARGQRRAPRGYEAKLERYFRTIDQ